ncbi:hypothetical protein [Acinetobacter baumannii]|uniref:hypothetical protein n=1 Tax=Acinetobacter baumannii TaxID=470 RepID=UPI000D64DB36|nr:hypothetical protein [Acinetobacter baumannii]EHU2311198.1 hypothetical protein [Acinetobacter baumannii]EHU2485646.1 hypothetical protein [Acinetobacter baumannii]
METKYDWSNVPPHIEWIAMDRDESVFGYSIKPDIGASQWYALAANPVFIEQIYDGYWSDSLEQRPAEKN